MNVSVWKNEVFNYTETKLQSFHIWLDEISQHMEGLFDVEDLESIFKYNLKRELISLYGNESICTQY